MVLNFNKGRLNLPNFAAILLAFLLVPVPQNIAQTTSKADETQETNHDFKTFASGIRINVSAGDVEYTRLSATSNVDQNLELVEGDKIITGKNSRAEFLLQPGNYLRLSEATECQFLGTQYDRVRIKLDKGTLNLELLRVKGGVATQYLGPLEQETDVLRVLTPAGEILIPEIGLYRIEVKEDGTTLVRVEDGQAFVAGQRVKEKQVLKSSFDRVDFSKVDPRSYDAFDAWCKARSQELVEANRSLKKEAWWAASDRKPGSEPTVDLTREGKFLESQFVVSARLGSINFVENDVEIGDSQSLWTAVTRQTQTKSGDHLQTKTYSHAELMLLPNVVLRLDGNSEIRIDQLSDEAISFKVLRGSAIIDAAKFDRKELPTLIFSQANTSFTVLDAGNYRIDVKNSLEAVTVLKGKVLVDNRTVGGCKRIEDGVEKECSKHPSDSFDLWSVYRGEGQIYDGRPTAAYLLQIRDRRFKSTGFWYHHPRLGYCTFVPFFFQGFESPYGGDYTTVLSPKSFDSSGPLWQDSRQFRRPIFSSPRP